jgi:hypothetical protein
MKLASGVASNNVLDPFREMRLATLTGRPAEGRRCESVTVKALMGSWCSRRSRPMGSMIS